LKKRTKKLFPVWLATFFLNWLFAPLAHLRAMGLRALAGAMGHGYGLAFVLEISLWT
jgi:hypothetical protein